MKGLNLIFQAFDFNRHISRLYFLFSTDSKYVFKFTIRFLTLPLSSCSSLKQLSYYLRTFTICCNYLCYSSFCAIYEPCKTLDAFQISHVRVWKTVEIWAGFDHKGESLPRLPALLYRTCFLFFHCDVLFAKFFEHFKQFILIFTVVYHMCNHMWKRQTQENKQVWCDVMW